MYLNTKDLSGEKSMRIIQEEAERANELKFDETEVEGYHNKIIVISQKNAAKAEFAMNNDSVYIRAGDKTALPKGSYNGSSAYWFSHMRLSLFDDKYNQYSYEYIVKNVIAAVDRENSTHLNADKCGREEMKKRIMNFGKENDVELSKKKLKDCLDKGTLDLYERLREKTDLSSYNNFSQKKYNPRENPSFASKFCHYACFYLFEDSDAQDNYPIFDNVVSKALPLYLKYYNLPDGDWYDYKSYREKVKKLQDYSFYRQQIDAIIKASEVEISRNAFDHLLWYYFKARPVMKDEIDQA